MMVFSWQFYAIASAFFAGVTAILAKMGVRDISSDLATFIRTIVIFLLTAIILSFKNEWSFLSKISSQAMTFLILSGLATGLSWLCYYRALQLGPASKVAPVDKLSIVFVLIMAVIFLGEKLTIKTIIGASLVSLGVFLLAL